MEAFINSSMLSQVAEVELVYRNTVKPSLRPKVTSSRDAYRILSDHWNADRIEHIEQFKVLLLNTASKVLGIYELSSGGISSTVVDVRLVFGTALKANATNIILAHNHPSGNLQPSHQDILLTDKIVRGGKLLDINVADHVILSTEGYYSFADEGRL